MQKSALFFVPIFSFASAFAQDGYYIKASGGAGITSSAFGIMSSSAAADHKNISSGQAQLNLGYTYGNLQLETGVGYLQTGVGFEIGPGHPGCMVFPGSTVPKLTAAGNYTIRNGHIVLPASIGYIINKRGKLSVVPGIGIEAAYNFEGKVSVTNRGESPQSLTPDYKYNQASALVLVKFDVQYRISRQLSIWCSPSYQQMVTSLTKKVQGDSMSRIYDHAMLVSLGVTYAFHLKVKTPKA